MPMKRQVWLRQRKGWLRVIEKMAAEKMKTLRKEVTSRKVKILELGARCNIRGIFGKACKQIEARSNQQSC